MCRIQSEYIEDNYNKGSLWARKLRDSWGKFPSGIFSGNYFDFGYYDQCIDFKHYSEDVGKIQGQYCLIKFPYQQRMRNDVSYVPRFAVDPHSSEVNIGIGICFPQACNHEDIKDVGNSTLMTLMNISLPSSYQPELFCSAKRDSFKFNALQMSVLAIFCVIVILIILSTSYEVTRNILSHPVNHLFASFSSYSNSKIMMTMKPFSSKEMMFLHGIRAITIIWILFGHTHLTYYNLPAINSLYFLNGLERFQLQLY
ncbi:hypothetical protein ACKWTF_008433 [Chironomus riparius]